MATTANGTPYVESSDLVANYPAASLALANQVDLFAKIRQVVRATDTTLRTSTSTSFVDAGISVTITPQKSDSAILLLWFFLARHTDTSNFSIYALTDNSNNVISGSEKYFGSSTTNDIYAAQTIVGYATPATTNATTYKGRFRVLSTGIAGIWNNDGQGSLYAIEVSA